MEHLTGPWDLVVVGHGFSGLSTALSHLQHATSEGRTPRVAVLECAPYEGRGGSTMWTHAFLRLNPQRMHGPSWAENVRANAGPLANESYISAFYENVPATLDWIQDKGVGLDSYPAPLAEEGTGWNVLGGARSVVEASEKRIIEAGGQIFYETTALRLERDAQGIPGVTVRSSSGIVSSMQTRTVVLACGGFEGNPEMLTHYLPDAYKLQTVSPGTRNNKGDGIRVAVEIGANTAGPFDGAHIEPCDPRSDGVEPLVSNWFYGILVGQNGKRFMDEAETSYDVQFDTIANEIFRSGRKVAYAINDAQVKRLLPWMDPMTTTEQPPIVADTIEGLATALGIDPTVLLSTVEDFNTAVDPGATFDPYNAKGGGCAGTRRLAIDKSNYTLPLTEGHFEAYPIGAPVCFTYGGISVDGETHVLDEDRHPITGLYATGEIAGTFYNEYPRCTAGLRSMTFGRVAGIVTAREAVARRVPVTV